MKPLSRKSLLFGCKNEMSFTTNFFFEVVTHIWQKYLLFVIYTENKSITDYRLYKDGQENK
jgi:hypothetical protein